MAEQVADWQPAGPLALLPEGEPIGRALSRADGSPVAVVLVRQGEVVRAFHDRCPHRGTPLSDLGFVDPQAGTLICGWHYWAFRLSDGAHTTVPGVGLCGYPTQVTPAGELLVDVAPRPAAP